MSCHQYEIRPRIGAGLIMPLFERELRLLEEAKILMPLERYAASPYAASPIMDFRKAPYMKYVNTYCEND